MSDEQYKDSLEAAKTEMETLLEEQSRTEMRLGIISSRLDVLRKTVLSLSELVGEEFEPEQIGITDAIRKALKGLSDDQGRYASPTHVRNALQKDGFPLGEYKNALAVIHTTLKRLDDQKEIESITIKEKVYYRWKQTTTNLDDLPI